VVPCWAGVFHAPLTPLSWSGHTWRGRQDHVLIRTTELQNCFVQGLPCWLGNGSPGAFRTGQRDTLNLRVGNEFGNLLVVSKDVLVHAFWDTRLVHHPLHC